VGDPAEETCRSPNQVDAKNVTPDCQRTVRNEFGALMRTGTFRPFSRESVQKNGADCLADVAPLEKSDRPQDVVGLVIPNAARRGLFGQKLAAPGMSVRWSSEACFPLLPSGKA
jgi:hypothetical protein